MAKVTRKKKCPGCESRTKMIDTLICALARLRGVSPDVVLNELHEAADSELARRRRKARA